MQITHTPQEQDMDIKAEVDGDTLKLVALNASADSWMGSNGFTPAGPACYTHEASELVQITICAGWEGLVVAKVDDPVFADTEEWGFCGCGVELSRMTSSDGEQCDDCNDRQVTQ